MFEVGQQVAVITDKGLAYDAIIVARAWTDEGSGAYKVIMAGNGLEQQAQWHKSSNVFLQEPVEEPVYEAEDELAFEKANESSFAPVDGQVTVPEEIDEAAPWKSFLKEKE